MIGYNRSKYISFHVAMDPGDAPRPNGKRNVNVVRS